jgi:DMSO reductase family type II enzyme molybdopterin subunit
MRSGGLEESAVAETDSNWADRYREKWTWDSVTWGTHSVDCYPGGCPFRVYTKNGKIVREEQASIHTPIEAGIPDRNPMGCQKGACWSHCHYSPDRITKPLKRAGKRGEGKWREVSWDEALGDIADAMLDAIEEQGPESIITPLTPEVGAQPARLFNRVLGTPTSDGNAEFQDFSPGWHLTWGVFNPTSSMDDWFLADLTLIWHANPVYTNIHWYHYLAESRYNGGEIVTIAPDYSPSAIHADYHQPIRIGTDTALALSMCKVIIDSGLYQKQFVQEQTDLPLLVRKDNGRFLRGNEVYDWDREDQFFWWNTLTGSLTSAPRNTLALIDVDPALEGTFKVTLSDLSEVEVEPVFQILKRKLEDYTPERAGEICEIAPDNIRKLARKVATRKTKIFIGWNSGKYYHGDLMERAMALLLGLTGNWGKKGTGTRSWAIMGMDGEAFMARKPGPGQEAAQKHIASLIAMRKLVSANDPTMTPEMVQNRAAEVASELGGMGNMIPPAFLWYFQYGYKDRWNDPENNDPTMKRSFDEYVTEAIEKGWFGAHASTAFKHVEPRVFFEAGGNVLRRQRGGQKLLLEHLWPKLKMIVSVDYRMTTTGLHSDYVLPAAQHYEKLVHAMMSVHHLRFVLGDKAVEPQGESLPDVEIGFRLLEKIEERAAERGLSEFKDYEGNVRSLVGLSDQLSQGGALREEEARFDEAIRDNAVYGLLPKGTTLETLREKGAVRFTSWGSVGHGISQGSSIRPDEIHTPMRWHVEDKVPYDTLVRRAQYYIDHEWFLEAGEELPTHKEITDHGGAKRRFLMTSGHNRWSIHSMNMTNNVLLNTHRGEPFVFINDDDAMGLEIENGDKVRMTSNVGEMLIQAKISPSVRPGQLIVYNGFEPYMHEDHYGQADLEPGHVKHLGLAGGYGHLTYRAFSWQPIPADRAVRCDIEKVSN